MREIDQIPEIILRQVFAVDEVKMTEQAHELFAQGKSDEGYAVIEHMIQQKELPKRGASVGAELSQTFSEKLHTSGLPAVPLTTGLRILLALPEMEELLQDRQVAMSLLNQIPPEFRGDQTKVAVPISEEVSDTRDKSGDKKELPTKSKRGVRMISTVQAVFAIGEHTPVLNTIDDIAAHAYADRIDKIPDPAGKLREITSFRSVLPNTLKEFIAHVEARAAKNSPEILRNFLAGFLNHPFWGNVSIEELKTVASRNEGWREIMERAKQAEAANIPVPKKDSSVKSAEGPVLPEARAAHVRVVRQSLFLRNDGEGGERYQYQTLRDLIKAVFQDQYVSAQSRGHKDSDWEEKYFDSFGRELDRLVEDIIIVHKDALLKQLSSKPEDRLDDKTESIVKHIAESGPFSLLHADELKKVMKRQMEYKEVANIAERRTQSVRRRISLEAASEGWSQLTSQQ